MRYEEHILHKQAGLPLNTFRKLNKSKSLWLISASSLALAACGGGEVSQSDDDLYYGSTPDMDDDVNLGPDLDDNTEDLDIG